MNCKEWEKAEERADQDLIAELRGPGTMKPCNNPGCNTCLCDCIWKAGAWLFNNPDALASVRRGLTDAAQGRVSKVNLDTL